MTPPALLLALKMASVAPALAIAPPPQSTHTNPIGAAVLAFKQRVDAYMKVHKDAESKVPKLSETTDPATVHEREAALGAMIKQLRPTAKEGDVFGADFAAVLAKEIGADFRGRSAADRKALIQELPSALRVGVNTSYPAGQPLATFPAQLLKKLPPLPPELEYRIIGRHIILRDVGGNVVVDIVRDIVPTIAH